MSGYSGDVNYLFKTYKISFYSVIHQKVISFKTFLTSFNDSVTPMWETDTVYGRMDVIGNYKITGRKINFSINVVAENASEAFVNYQKLRVLQTWQYPKYELVGKNNEPIISTPPILGIKFNNLIYENMGAKKSSAPFADLNKDYLFGFIDGEVSVNPIVEDGFLVYESAYDFDDSRFVQLALYDRDDGKTKYSKDEKVETRAAINSLGKGDVYARAYDFSISFTVIHRLPVNEIVADANRRLSVARKGLASQVQSNMIRKNTANNNGVNQ